MIPIATEQKTGRFPTTRHISCGQMKQEAIIRTLNDSDQSIVLPTAVNMVPSKKKERKKVMELSSKSCEDGGGA